MEDFKHEALEDLSRQFRLLRIQPANCREHVTITVETFQRQSAPPYAALSYTWGDATLLKQIIANGKLFDVTRECWYALGQLRLLGISEYYWIDAISINQKDDMEESAQVNLMGDTFRDAICTVASLGRKTKEITFFLEQVTRVSLDCENAGNSSVIETPGWLRAFDEAALERLLTSLSAFAELPYWSRLWTAQEFALSPNLVIACGAMYFDWSQCKALNAMMCKLLDINKDWYRGKMALHTDSSSSMRLPMNRTEALRSIVRSPTDRLATFTEVVLKLGSRKCFDPRDRIFGLLSLTHWPQERAPLNADYNMPASKVAEIALEYADGPPRIEAALQLCGLLEIGATDSEMIRMTQQRKQEYSSLQWLYRVPSIYAKHAIRAIASVSITGREMSRTVSEKWKTLVTESVHALVPICARSGDLIIWCEIGKGIVQPALLLRKDDSGVYCEIKGHVMLASTNLATFARPSALEIEEFDVFLANDDLLFWVWQLRHGAGPCKFASAIYERDPSWFETGFCGSPLRSYVTCFPCEDVSSSKNYRGH